MDYSDKEVVQDEEHVKKELAAQEDAISEVYPQSYGQRALWLHYQLAPESWAYTVHIAFRIRSEIDCPALQRALQELLRRHPILRTTFATCDDYPVQQVHTNLHVPLEIHSCSIWSQNERYRFLQAEIRRPFALEHHYPFRITLLTASQDHTLLFVFHHIAADGWTMNILVREIFLLYDAEVAGQKSALPPVHAHYADFVHWQNTLIAGEEGEQLRAYWREQLTGELQSPGLFKDASQSGNSTDDGTTFVFAIDEVLTHSLRELALAEGVTLYTMLLTCYLAFLHRYGQQDDILVGSPMLGRSISAFEQVAGDFTNLVVLRANASGNPTFRQFLEHVQQIVMDALEHQDYPFALLVEDLHVERTPDRLPLANVAFVLESLSLFRAGLSPFVLGEEGTQIRSGKLILEPYAFLPQQEGLFDFALLLYEKELSLQGLFQYKTALFENAAVSRMAQHFLTMARNFVSSPDQRLGEVALLTPEDYSRMLVRWNQTRYAYPREQCVHQLFEQWAVQTPDAIALCYGDLQISYGELNQRANQLAHALRARGIKVETPVGLCLDRSPELIVGMLGILKAGGAYVPLDPNYPTERLAFMMKDARLLLLLTQKSLGPQLPAAGPPQLLLDEQWPQIAQYSTQSPENWSQPGNLAYIIYTSGSTGQPKGVEIVHYGITRLLFAATYAHFGAEQRILHLSSITFDPATFEVWGALLHGACCVLYPERMVTPGQLQAFIQKQRVTMAWLTASLFNTIIDEQPAALAGLQQLLIGGEALSVGHVRRAIDHLPAEMQIINGYGPTESTTFTCCHPIQAGDVDEALSCIPIGRPIGNTQVYVLDSHLQPVPPDVAGELYIGGDGLARGYTGQPVLTAEHFIPNPFAHEPGSRLYKTGDRVYWRTDGTLLFLGRFDDQVKIRGYRIEPGEIAATLERHASVQSCLILERGTMVNNKSLLAYIVPADPSHASSAAGARHLISNLRSYLYELLPEYMVPASFVITQAFPLTPGGKVDRQALAMLKPVEETTSLSGSITAVTPTEKLIAEIWSQVLRLEQVSITESFFTLGGHSLLAMQIVARIERIFQMTFPLRLFFKMPTIESVARQVEQLRARAEVSGTPPLIPRQRREELLPLSFAQQRLWFLDKLVPNNPFYTIPLAWQINGALDVVALEQSIHALVQRHESLRTIFVQQRGHPSQRILSMASVPASMLTVTDLSTLDTEIRAERARQEAIREAQIHFDLQTDLPLRAYLLRLASREHILLLTLHHIACDGWSLGLLQHELSVLYTAFAAGQPSPLHPLPVQYADFAVWQRAWEDQDGLEESLTYWRQQLANLPVLELPLDSPRPVTETFHGARVPLQLSASLLHQLKALSNQQEVTLFMTLLAAFQVVLMRYSGQQDIVIGVPIANRQHEELEELIGMFVNTLVIRTNLSCIPCVKELLQIVRRVMLEAYEHQNVPFERIVEELSPERTLERNPLCQVSFQLFNAPQETLDLPKLRIHPLEFYNATAKLDVQLTCWENAQGLALIIEYNADLFAAETMHTMGKHFQRVLEAFVEAPQQHLAKISLLTQEERYQILLSWNQTEKAYPQDLCVHQIFEQQAALAPETLALVCGTEQMTYGELERRANQLAHALRASGVRPEVVVGLGLERSPELIIAMLGVLKAGGAYLPLDLAHPAARLAFMIENARLSLLLTCERLASRLPADGPALLLLDTDWPRIARYSTCPPENWNQPLNLAYVTYTSGSTGRPKGIEITHQGIPNVVWEQMRHFQIRRGMNFMQWASISFDGSVWEIMMALLTGGILHLTPPAGMLLGEEFARFISEHAIEILSMTPSALATLPTRDFPQARIIAVAGEDCPATLAHTWGSRYRFYNVYGPTEATIWSSVALYNEKQEKISMGRPIANTQLYVLDTQLQPLPPGIPGELYIGGVGLARGYRKRPDLTAERFIPHPFSLQPGARLYRTGDRVRYLPNGSIEFLGRMDQQAKIRGYRIELKEIEEVLGHYPMVDSCLVQNKEIQPNDRRLVAYLKLKEGQILSREDLERFLKQQLPAYMLPAHFVLLDAFPLTPNGKIDTRVLPSPLERCLVPAMSQHIAPRTKTEQLLAKIWQDVLGISNISIQDGFFALGGHSLLIAHLVTEIQEQFDLLLPLATVMEHNTLEALAIVIDTWQHLPQSLPLDHEPIAGRE